MLTKALVARHRISKDYILIMAAMALVALLLIMALVTSPAVPMKLMVLSYSDPYGLGRVTSMSVEVTNESERPLEPRFSVQLGPYPFYWRVSSGPAVLPPGAEAVYFLESPSIEAALPSGAQFILRVNDSAGSSFAVIHSLAARIVSLAIINPSLSFWRMGDMTAYPWGWQPTIKGIGKITQVKTADVLGTQLLVEQNGSGEWAEASMSQDIPICRVMRVTVNRALDFRRTPAQWPTLAFGAEVRAAGQPGPNFIWFVFSQGQEESYSLPNGPYVVIVPTPREEWASVTLPLEATFQKFGLPQPGQTLFKLFVAAHESELGQYMSAVAGVECSEPG